MVLSLPQKAYGISSVISVQNFLITVHGTNLVIMRQSSLMEMEVLMDIFLATNFTTTEPEIRPNKIGKFPVFFTILAISVILSRTHPKNH